MLVYWMIWYCLVSGVLSVVWSSILYVMVWVYVPCDIVHWSAVPHQCIAYRTVFGVCVVLMLNVIRCSCHYFLDRIVFHHVLIMTVVTITGIFMAINYLLISMLGFLYISSSGSANAQLPGCFRPWTLSLNIGLTMFPFDSFMSCLHSLLGHSTGQFQALQLILCSYPCGVWCLGLTFWKSSLRR